MPELSAEAIASAGLAIVDEGGAPALTMRAVARRLGVSPMALYHHVTDKAALIALMSEQAMVERPLPLPREQGWQEDIWQLASWMRDGMQRHPAMAALRQQFQAWTPSMFAFGERWISLWQQSGLDPDDAARAAVVTLMAVVGVAVQEQVLPPFVPPDDPSLAWLPNLRSELAKDRDGDRAFELLVRSLVDGAVSRLAGGAG